MKALPRYFGLSVALVIALIFSATASRAQTLIFTFEQFSTIPPTPLLNVLPEVGDGSLRANFSAENIAITTMASFGVVSGNVLSTGGSVIQVTLNNAVNSVSLGFVSRGGNFSIGLSSASGGTSVTSHPLGAPGMKGGILSFASATAFRSFTLTSSRDDFSIDNLAFGPVVAGVPVAVGDSGQTLVLLGAAAAALVAFRRRSAAAL